MHVSGCERSCETRSGDTRKHDESASWMKVEAFLPAAVGTGPTMSPTLTGYSACRMDAATKERPARPPHALPHVPRRAAMRLAAMVVNASAGARGAARLPNSWPCVIADMRIARTVCTLRITHGASRETHSPARQCQLRAAPRASDQQCIRMRAVKRLRPPSRALWEGLKVGPARSGEIPAAGRTVRGHTQSCPVVGGRDKS